MKKLFKILPAAIMALMVLMSCSNDTPMVEEEIEAFLDDWNTVIERSLVYDDENYQIMHILNTSDAYTSRMFDTAGNFIYIEMKTRYLNGDDYVYTLWHGDPQERRYWKKGQEISESLFVSDLNTMERDMLSKEYEFHNHVASFPEGYEWQIDLLTGSKYDGTEVLVFKFRSKDIKYDVSFNRKGVEINKKEMPIHEYDAEFDRIKSILREYAI